MLFNDKQSGAEDESQSNGHMRERSRGLVSSQTEIKKWSLPGGKVETGEAIAAAAVRELQEETGLNVDQILYVFELDADHTRHHVFEASVPDGESAVPQNEIVECTWHSLSTFQDLDTSEATKSIIRSFLRRL